MALQAHLGVLPEARTVDLYRQIVDGTLRALRETGEPDDAASW
jgi:hypothetical protein